jgi:hypothetical protein
VLSRGALAAWAALGGVVALSVGLGARALVGGLRALRAGTGFDPLPALARLAPPATVGDWLTVAGLVVLAALGALATAATLAARRGVAGGPAR